MNCQGTTTAGVPCRSTIVDTDGWCATHRPGNEERMRENRVKGGEARMAKMATEGFRAGELPALTDHASVKRSIEAAMNAAAERRITHHELGAHTKACETWLKVDGAQVTKQLVNDLQKELTRAQRELEQLRRQLSDRGRGFKASVAAVS